MVEQIASMLVLVITIAVLAIWCWQLHVSLCHDILPPPAVLAKGVIHAVGSLVLC